MLPLASIGATEIGIVILVIVLLFGIKRLPELGKSLAEGIHEFKKASRKAQEDDTDSKKQD